MYLIAPCLRKWRVARTLSEIIVGLIPFSNNKSESVTIFSNLGNILFITEAFIGKPELICRLANT